METFDADSSCFASAASQQKFLADVKSCAADQYFWPTGTPVSGQVESYLKDELRAKGWRLGRDFDRMMSEVGIKYAYAKNRRGQQCTIYLIK